jgi:hypothetical protein
VGKAVLVANALPISRHFDGAPIIQPVLFKTVVYFLVVFLVRVLEKLVEYWLGGGSISGIPDYVSTHFTWHRFIAIQIWIFVLFLTYTSITELNALFGEGELFKIVFARRSSELKLTRRQRIRTLVRLSRLTDTHTLDEIRDPRTAVHAEIIDLIRGLATQRDAATRQASPGL